MVFSRWLLLLALVGASGCATAGAGAGATPAAAAPTSATAGATTIVAVQPAAAPASPPCTIWQFLGVPGAAKGVCSIVSCIQNRLGTLFPGLEAKPALLAITDPANLQSSNPAVSAAAGAKADEDAAPQKVKAINYLGTIGCGGCYPDVQDALLAALDDCTEAVRFAAASALRGTACGQCRVCRKKSCCSPKVMEKLYKVANDVDDTGCYKEPSPRVRRMARLAMSACGGGVPEPTSAPLEGPSEGPPGGPAALPGPAPAEVPPVVRAVSPATRYASRPPIVVAAAGHRSQADPPGAAAQPAPVNSPTAASPSMPADCGLPAPQNVAVAAPPATTTPEPSPTEAAAEVPADTSHTPAPIVKPAPIRRTDPEPPVRTRSASPGPTVSNQASPAVAQPVADTSNSPTAVATGIELVQPGSEASGSSNPPLPVVTRNPVRPASPAGQPQMSTAGIPGLPIATNNPSQPPASAPLRSAGPLAIFQSQATARANMIRNPFVDDAAGDAKKVALVSDNQALPGDSAATAAATQLANWQVDAARPNQAAAPPAVAAPQARVSDDQLLAYYRQNAGNYRGPPEVRWVWIRVRFNSHGAKPDTYAAAAALRQAAVEGQLAEAVRKYPQTEVLRFTWTPADRLPSKSIAKALLRMRAGEVSVMLESASGVEIVQLLESRSATLSFEQAREQVQQDLLNSSRR